MTADAGVASPELPSARWTLAVKDTRNQTEWRLATDVTYSPRTDLELRLRVPFVHRRLDFEDFDGNVTGLDDVALRAKYALLREDDVMRSDRISFVAEAFLPTADHHEGVLGMELPRRLQPGLGTAGIGAGPVFTIVRDRHRASVEAGVRLRVAHDRFEPGEELYANAAYWFRLSPARFEPGSDDPELRLVFELLTTTRRDDWEDGVDLGNGGTEAFGLLGLQANLSMRTRLELAAFAPVIDEMDDALGERRLGALASFKVYF